MIDLMCDKKVKEFVYIGRNYERMKRQNRFLRKRYTQMRRQENVLRDVRHDMRNSIILEMEYLKNDRHDLLMEYYQQTLGILTNVERTEDTGNLSMDSVLNYKLDAARRRNIKVNCNVQIWGDVRVSDYDLNLLIGNLMDNAMEAVEELPQDKKEINLQISADGISFLMKISNPFKGMRYRDRKGNYRTGKRNKKWHGLGLRKVKKIVHKYRGQLSIKEQTNMFEVKAFLYMTT